MQCHMTLFLTGSNVLFNVTPVLPLTAFPSAPVISGGDHLRLGTESILICQVSDVYPPELLSFIWLRGDTILHSTMGDPGSSLVLSEYRFHPVKQDHGANITCKATLDLQVEDRTKETSMLLKLLCESTTVMLSSRHKGKTLFCIRPRRPDSEVQTQDKDFPVLQPGSVT